MNAPATAAPSLVMQMYLLEKYGPRLTTEQMGEVLGMTQGAILTSISANRFPVPTYVEGKRRYADFRDVAVYFDQRRSEALRVVARAAGSCIA